MTNFKATASYILVYFSWNEIYRLFQYCWCSNLRDGPSYHNSYCSTTSTDQVISLNQEWFSAIMLHNPLYIPITSFIINVIVFLQVTLYCILCWRRFPSLTSSSTSSPFTNGFTLINAMVPFVQFSSFYLVFISANSYETLWAQTLVTTETSQHCVFLFVPTTSNMLHMPKRYFYSILG